MKIVEKGVCFWCGQTAKKYTNFKNKSMFRNYKPCEVCRSLMKSGITLVEVRSDPIGDELPLDCKQLGSDMILYPTGRFKVLSHEEARKTLSNEIVDICSRNDTPLYVSDLDNFTTNKKESGHDKKSKRKKAKKKKGPKVFDTADLSKGGKENSGRHDK